MQIHSVGIDLGKTTFHLVALGAAGKVLVKKKFTQRQLLTFTANMQTSLIGLEACSGAHFLGRALRKQGHDVWLLYMFPRYLDDYEPALMSEIRRDCPTTKVFKGTLGGGDVFVCKLQTDGKEVSSNLSTR